jgi:hypothetical protein
VQLAAGGGLKAKVQLQRHRAGGRGHEGAGLQAFERGRGPFGDAFQLRLLRGGEELGRLLERAFEPARLPAQDRTLAEAAGIPSDAKAD